MARVAVRTLGQPIKNYLINGDFGIWQRNVGTAGPFTEDTSYTYKSVDRWQHRFDDAIASSTLRQWARVNDAPVTVLTASPFGVGAFRHIFRRGNLGIWASLLAQKVESYLAAEMYNQNPSGKVSVSVWIKSLTATNVSMTLATANTKDTFSSVTTVLASNKTFTNNGTWQQIKWEGIPVTAAFVNGVSVQFVIVTPAAVGADGTDQELRVSMAQLNKGEVISDFSLCEATHADELALCQRYYEKSFDLATDFSTPTSTGSFRENSASGGIFRSSVRYKVKKRVLASPINIYSVNATTAMRIYMGGINQVASVVVNGESGFAVEAGGAANTDCLYQFTADAEIP